MARAYGQRPSHLLGLRDPLPAYQFDAAVFSLEEAIEGALDRERRSIDMADLDGKGRRSVEKAEKRLAALLDRIFGRTAERRAREAQRARRPVEYLWSDDRTEILGWRYADRAVDDG